MPSSQEMYPSYSTASGAYTGQLLLSVVIMHCTMSTSPLSDCGHITTTRCTPRTEWQTPTDLVV